MGGGRATDREGHHAPSRCRMANSPWASVGTSAMAPPRPTTRCPRSRGRTMPNRKAWKRRAPVSGALVPRDPSGEGSALAYCRKRRKGVSESALLPKSGRGQLVEKITERGRTERGLVAHVLSSPVQQRLSCL